MRRLLFQWNQIYIGIVLTTFLLFTVSDGKNQLLLALLKCTGKVFWLLAIQDCTYTSPAELYVTPCAYLWVLFAEHLALVLAFYANFSYALHLGQPFHVSDLYSSVSVASIPCRLLCCPASHWCCTSTVFLSFFFFCTTLTPRWPLLFPSVVKTCSKNETCCTTFCENSDTDIFPNRAGKLGI